MPAKEKPYHRRINGVYVGRAFVCTLDGDKIKIIDKYFGDKRWIHNTGSILKAVPSFFKTLGIELDNICFPVDNEIKCYVSTKDRSIRIKQLT